MNHETAVLGYVHNGTVCQEFMQSVLACLYADWRDRQVLTTTLATRSPSIAHNRNEVVRQFLQTDADWLWFVDTDMAFDPDTAYRMIDAANECGAKILSALYFGYSVTDLEGQPILWPQWFRFRRKDEETTITLPVVQKIEPGIQELGAAGMGCCIIHRDVLVAMKEKYGSDGWIWFAHDLCRDRHGAPARMGEDVSFCARAAAVGYKTFGHGAIGVGHIKSRTENWSTFFASQRSGA
jgi:hypothetical protein